MNKLASRRLRWRLTVHIITGILIELKCSDASCQLHITVGNNGNQAELQLLCDKSMVGTCQIIQYNTQNNMILGIPEDCTPMCTTQFNICENSCMGIPTTTNLFHKPETEPEEDKKGLSTHTSDTVYSTAKRPFTLTAPVITRTVVGRQCLATTTVTVLLTTTETSRDISTNTVHRRQCVSTIIHPTPTSIYRKTPSQCLNSTLTKTVTTVQVGSTTTPCVQSVTKVVQTKISTVTLSPTCASFDITTKAQNENSSSSVLSALGALVGILMILLAFVTTALVGTCWVLKKRGGIKNTFMQNNCHNTPSVICTNYDSDTLKRLHNPLYEEALSREQIETEVEQQTPDTERETEESGPTYEVIPLPSVVNKKSKENRKVHSNQQGTLNVGSSTHVEGVFTTHPYESTNSSLGLLDKGNTNNSQQKERGKWKNSCKKREDVNHSILLSSAHEQKEDGCSGGRNKDGKEDAREVDGKYEDQLEQEEEHIYHILEGPTPILREEESKSESLNILATAYEIPLTLLTTKQPPCNGSKIE